MLDFPVLSPLAESTGLASNSGICYWSRSLCRSYVTSQQQNCTMFIFGTALESHVFACIRSSIAQGRTPNKKCKSPRSPSGRLRRWFAQIQVHIVLNKAPG